MPDDADRRGARVGAPGGRDSRRGGVARDAVLLLTRDFLEQIGQFSTIRLWRQKVGIPGSV
jgi:hypothetical protein